MINKVIEIGRLVRDAELKRTTSGMSVAQFSLAVEAYSKKSKENQACFFECVSFGVVAENLVKFTHKGEFIAIDGHLVQESYTTKKGESRNQIKIYADTIQFISEKNKNSNSNAANENVPEEDTLNDKVAPVDDGLPF